MVKMRLRQTRGPPPPVGSLCSLRVYGYTTDGTPDSACVTVRHKGNHRNSRGNMESRNRDAKNCEERTLEPPTLIQSNARGLEGEVGMFVTLRFELSESQRVMLMCLARVSAGALQDWLPRSETMVVVCLLAFFGERNWQPRSLRRGSHKGSMLGNRAMLGYFHCLYLSVGTGVRCGEQVAAFVRILSLN